MQITTKDLSPTKIELIVTADAAMLQATKERVLKDLSKQVNLAGFRKGHAPLPLVEKNVDQSLLQSQFLDHAANDMYVAAIAEKKLRPVAQPDVNVTKFVPFTALEFKATVEVVGKITLPDYKKVKVIKKIAAITDKDVTAVLDDLLRREAEKEPVQRAAKDGDEVVIDFSGVDAKTKQAIDGATGTDYPLVIGSGSFIPGFEPELIGIKPTEEKTFDIVFPADYGAKELQKKKVTFTVTVKTVREIALPKLDDAFAAKVGPFKTVAELKADIKKQLQAEAENRAQRDFENELLATIAEKAKADIPVSLVNEEIERMELEEKRNLLYRGQTWQEHLKAEGRTEEQHRENLREQAEARVKTGLVLGEVAEVEGLSVGDAELDKRIAQLKKQYPSDKQMQTELDKRENRRELMSRLLTEKTIARLSEYVTAN
ncbi:MAG TPA: trigger factor [Candidatus Saccharimonadales bacterium]|nr:trigger factor [Candidatus Saccharimonadales bacterium]